MNQSTTQPANDTYLKWILAFGFLVKIFFTLWGAPVYYSTPNFATCMGDTWSWVSAMKNLIHNGTFTTDLNYPGGKFYKPPGYSFFMGIFYLLSGYNLNLSLKLTMWAQVIMDGFSVWLIYRIVRNIRGTALIARIISLMYVLYPFVLVWNPILTAETPSIFFMLAGLYYLTKPVGKYNYLLSGVFLGITVLMRLQCIFIMPAVAFYLIKKHGGFPALFRKPAFILLFTFGLVYGSWPLRNLLQGAFIPAEQIENNLHFSKDYTAFMFYIWAIKTDHHPQYEQIIHGQPVEWPKASYLEPGDSAVLADLVVKCNTCGRGFSYFKASAGLIPRPILEETPCTIEIANTFDRLRHEQIVHNPVHYFLIVPMGNLYKALFKSNLYGQKSALVRTVSTLLFAFRTLMIFLGFYGIWLNRKLVLIDRNFANLILFYFISWYFVLCFGYRNIEIRYFLHPDVLLLLPAVVPIVGLLKRWKPELFTNEARQ